MPAAGQAINPGFGVAVITAAAFRRVPMAFTANTAEFTPLDAPAAKPFDAPSN